MASGTEMMLKSVLNMFGIKPALIEQAFNEGLPAAMQAAQSVSIMDKRLTNLEKGMSEILARLPPVVKEEVIVIDNGEENADQYKLRIAG